MLWSCLLWRVVHIMEVAILERCPYCGGVHNGYNIGVHVVELSIMDRCLYCVGVHHGEVPYCGGVRN